VLAPVWLPADHLHDGLDVGRSSTKPPDIWIFIGAPIVVASGLYIGRRERQLAKPVVTEVVDEGLIIGFVPQADL